MVALAAVAAIDRAAATVGDRAAHRLCGFTGRWHARSRAPVVAALQTGLAVSRHHAFAIERRSGSTNPTGLGPGGAGAIVILAGTVIGVSGVPIRAGSRDAEDAAVGEVSRRTVAPEDLVAITGMITATRGLCELWQPGCPECSAERGEKGLTAAATARERSSQRVERAMIH